MNWSGQQRPACYLRRVATERETCGTVEKHEESILTLDPVTFDYVPNNPLPQPVLEAGFLPLP
jgi:hypothetical protein